MTQSDLSSQLAALSPERRRAIELLLQRERARERVARDLYTTAWKQAPVAGGSRRLGVSWLVIADRGAFGGSLAQQLEAQGGRSKLVQGDGPLDGAMIRAWLEERAEYRNIVFLSALDGTPAAATTADTLMLDQERACSALLELVRVIAAGGGPDARLWIVTRGAQRLPADGNAMAITQAPLLGLGRSFGLEHPELYGGLVDVDPAWTEAPAALATQLMYPDAEVETAWRDNQRFAPRLVPAKLQPRDIPQRRLPNGASYLITGGTSELALHLARWLAGQGARSIVLMSRSEGGPDIARQRHELEARGVTVRLALGDVTKSADVERVVSDIAATLPPLRGVVHAAAVVDYGMLRQQTWQRFAPVMAPKIAGAWNLHRATRGTPLDFFVMYSSLSALGYEASSNYAAANAFMDAFAHARRSEGLPATAINWTAWSKIGGIKKLSKGDQDRLTASGVGYIDPDDGMQVMSLVIAGENRVPPQVVVHPITDVEKLRWYLRSRGEVPLFSELTTTPEAARDDGELTFLQRVRAASRPEAEALVDQQLRASTIAVLGLDANVSLDTRRPLVDIGMTSLLANDFRLRLAADVGMPRGALPATLAFNYPTIEALRGHLLDDVLPKLALDAPPKAPVASPTIEQPAAAAETPAVAATVEATVDPSAIAVVGMSCRFPGGAETPERLWRVLTDSMDLTREVPKERWDAEAFYDPDPDAPGRSITRLGTFVDGWDMFDPSFFNMSPREAAATDPQQRLLLELAWSALADAGYAPADIFDTKAGVFAAVYGTDYIAQLVRAGPEAIDVYTAAGIAHGVAAGRLSYALGVHGPSMTLDAACSSSLVAVHLAAQSLRNGECDVAIVGATSAMLGPNGHMLLTKTRMISPDGRSKAFDASADGYGRSEGGCVIVLKRADAALRDGDTVHALVRGSAVNQDGRSASLVAPNGPAQEAVIRAALQDAHLTADDIDYVECAGTGSSMGDAIEYGALAQVFGGSATRARPLVIGSVKTNIGHTESVSGLAGLMKMVLALRHETLPPHLHLRELNDECRPQNGELVVGAERRPWRRGAGRRLASVQSYGMSGTNAHVILEEPPLHEVAEANAGPSVLRLSARSPGALERVAKQYARYIREYPSQSIASICRTAQRGRADGSQRLAVVARDRAALLAALEGEVEGAALAFRGEADHQAVTRAAFVFAPTVPLALARQLLPADDAIIARCTNAVRGMFAASLGDVLSGAGGGSEAAALALVAGYAVQCALWERWRRVAPTPQAIAGQGLGEIAAAYAAGLIDLAQGATLVAEVARRAVVNLPESRWLVVAEDVERVKAVLGMTPGWSVVAVNGPRSTTIGGGAAVIDEARRLLASQSIVVSDTSASTTLHTRLHDIVDADVGKWLVSFAGDEPSVPFISSVTGRVIGGRDLRTPQYWSRMLRSSVQARDTFRSIAKLGVTAFIEIGDGTTVLPHLRETLGDEGRIYVAAFDTAAPEDMRVEAEFAKAYSMGLAMAGHEPSDGDFAPRALDVPAYELDRERCWLPAGASAVKPTSSDSSVHPLLGLREVRDDAWVYRSRHSTERLAFLRDHGNYGTPIFPGMAFIEMAFAAAADAFPHQPISLADVTFERALLLEKQPRDVELVLKTRDDKLADYVVRSRGAGADTWVEHTRGVVRRDEGEESWTCEPLAAVRARLTRVASADALYELMQKHGQDYGAAFRGMTAVWRPPVGTGEAIGRIELPRHVRGEVSGYRAHPALLDACGHPTYIAVNGDASTDGSFMFAGAEVVRLRRGANVAVWSHVVAKPVAASATRRVFTADIHVYDDDGRLVAEFLGVRNVAVEADSMVRLAAAPVAAASVSPEPPMLTRQASAGTASLRELVTREVAVALGMAPDRAIGGKQVLKDLGLDSLVAVQLRNRLQIATGASLPVTLLFEYPTVQALVDFLMSRGVDASGSPKTTTAQAGTATPVAVRASGTDSAHSPRPQAVAKGVTSRLSAVLAAIDELDDGELDVLATEILGEGR